MTDITTPPPTPTPTPWYQNGDVMKGYAGLASSFVNAALLFPKFSAYNQMLKDAKFNNARAHVAANRSDTMYANLSNHRLGGTAVPASTAPTTPSAPTVSAFSPQLGG